MMTERLLSTGGNVAAFTDSSRSEITSVSDSTLAVGRNATLTLGTDSLVVLDEGLLLKDDRSCFALFRNKPKNTRTIPYFNVLSAEICDLNVTVQYAHAVSKSLVRATTIEYDIDKTERDHASSWIERLMDRAYGLAQRRKRIKVLINPHGGKGFAQSLYDRDMAPIFAAAGCDLSVESTQYSGHAAEIAEKLDVSKWDVVACCSGDGLPHEVFNGLAKQKHAITALKEIAVVQLPCGTGNAMSLNLNGTDSPSLAALCVVKGLRMPLDLVSFTQGDKRTLSFLSQSLGILAESDLGTDHLRWMGDLRFMFGFLMRLLRKKAYPCEVAVQLEMSDRAAIKKAYAQEMAKGPLSAAEVVPSSPSWGKNSTVRPEATSQIPPLAGTDSPSASHPDDAKSSQRSASDASSPSTALPPLRFGTVTSPLPPNWRLVPHPHLANFFAGNMAFMAASTNIFPQALPSDGCLDLVTYSATTSRLTSLRALGSTADGSFTEWSHIEYTKISAYRVIPKPRAREGKGVVSVDGESFPYEPFQAEVHGGLGTVLSRSGRFYEGGARR